MSSTMPSSSCSSDIDYLERELRRELEEFDCLLAADTSHSLSLSLNDMAFELAEQEGEKEAMQDRLHLLLARSEDMESEMGALKLKLLQLTLANEKLSMENDTLRRIGTAHTTHATHTSSSGPHGEEGGSKYNDLEYKLAVTRSNLARAQQVAEDQVRAGSDRTDCGTLTVSRIMHLRDILIITCLAILMSDGYMLIIVIVSVACRCWPGKWSRGSCTTNRGGGNTIDSCML